MEEGLICRLKRSFEILSEKYVANNCGRAAIGDDVGTELFAFLCRMLLIVSKELEVWMRRTGQVRHRMIFWRRL